MSMKKKTVLLALMLAGVMCMLAGKVLRRSGDKKKKNDAR